MIVDTNSFQARLAELHSEARNAGRCGDANSKAVELAKVVEKLIEMLAEEARKK